MRALPRGQADARGARRHAAEYLRGPRRPDRAGPAHADARRGRPSKHARAGAGRSAARAGLAVALVSGISAVGGGSAPGVELPTVLVALEREGLTAASSKRGCARWPPPSSHASSTIASCSTCAPFRPRRTNRSRDCSRRLDRFAGSQVPGSRFSAARFAGASRFRVLDVLDQQRVDRGRVLNGQAVRGVRELDEARSRDRCGQGPPESGRGDRVVRRAHDERRNAGKLGTRAVASYFRNAPSCCIAIGGWSARSWPKSGASSSASRSA